MNDLRENPVGMALAGVSGFIVLVGLVLAWAWTRPVTAPEPEAGGAVKVEAPAGAAAVELAPISAYRVVTDRPLFSETRRPTVGEEALVEEVEDVKPDSFSPPPEARLTGIVITPDQKMATLMPNDGSKPLLAMEGQTLGGEYATWEVTSIEPRRILMVSAAGRELAMDLVVHDTEIAEPPKPEPPPQADEAAEDADSLDGEDDEPMSRAEQIRQRIQERREELRRQQEERDAEGAGDNAREESNTASPQNRYTSAISAMMSGNRNSDKKEDDNDNE